jgi:hypothetical protein
VPPSRDQQGTVASSQQVLHAKASKNVCRSVAHTAPPPPLCAWALGLVGDWQWAAALARELEGTAVVQNGLSLGGTLVASSLGALEAVGRTALDVVGEQVCGRYASLGEGAALRTCRM